MYGIPRNLAHDHPVKSELGASQRFYTDNKNLPNKTPEEYSKITYKISGRTTIHGGFNSSDSGL